MSSNSASDESEVDDTVSESSQRSVIENKSDSSCDIIPKKRKEKKKPSHFRTVVDKGYSPPPKNNKYIKRKNDSKKCCAKKCAVRKNAPLLELLVRATDEERKCVLKHIDNSAVDIICCCVFNAIYNKEIIPKERLKIIRKKLGKFTRPLVYLSQHRHNRKKRKKLLVQQGAGLPLLLASVIPIIKSSTIGELKKKKGKRANSSSDREIVRK